MLVLVRIGIARSTILKLQEVRLCQIISPARQQVGTLIFKSLTKNEVDVVLPDMTVISQSVLYQGVRVIA